MSAVPDFPSLAKPPVVAALLLAAASVARDLGLPAPTVGDILARTGASRSRAYELRDRLIGVLAQLTGSVGRPRAAPDSGGDDTAQRMGTLQQAMIAFLMDHPGCVTGGTTRRRYTDLFRRFVVGLRDHYADLDAATFAAAVGLPLPTVTAWLRDASATLDSSSNRRDGQRPPTLSTDTASDPHVPQPPAPASDDDTPVRFDAAGFSAHLQTIIDEWRTWRGDFSAFCTHLQTHCRLPFGRTFIGSVLRALGLRRPQSRRGRSPDEIALRGAFETFFPGAQWGGDGSTVSIQLGDQLYHFNLELVVDTSSAAALGAAVTDTEDSAAVVGAFSAAVATAGQPPLALLLDNKPANHTDTVDAALGDTLRLRSTLARPQNNAHTEGAFGLFSAALPPLVVDAEVPRERARQILTMVTIACLRGLNHRPRRDRDGRSRVDLYREAAPTDDEIATARDALEKRRRTQQRARQTAAARQDPTKRELLDRAFARLELVDPESHVRLAIARYPLDDIADGIAIFDGKRRANTLPPDVDARYLLGIVRNLANEREGRQIADALLRTRLEARDIFLASLVAHRDQLETQHADIHDRLLACVDLGLEAQSALDRLFWLSTAADLLATTPEHACSPLFRTAARRIHATYHVPHRHRLEASRLLAHAVVPLP